MVVFKSLETVIDRNGLECLNIDPGFSQVLDLVTQPNVNLFCQSMDDPQLLIRIPFKFPVKIGQISLKVNRDILKEGSGPKTVKLYINDPNLDFSGLDSAPPKQTITFTEGNLRNGDKIDLKFVNFQSVKHLTILIDDNQKGFEVTKVGFLGLYGMPEEKMDMESWKPVDRGDDE